MSADNVAPMLEPDAGMIRQHLELLFTCPEYSDGLIEIAWRNAKTGALDSGQLFEIDQIDKAIECAVIQNRVPGQSVYVGAALRAPDTAPFGRTTDQDFYAATHVWADFDKPEDFERARAVYTQIGVPPSLAVITGTVPNLRFQLWWRLREAMTNAEALKALNRAAAQTFGGDRAVTNPSRLMRLAGTLAWPVKNDARKLEITELRAYPGRAPYDDHALLTLFGGNAPAADAATVDALRNSPASQSGGGTPLNLDARSTIGGKLSAAVLIARIRSGQEWHNNMVRLVAHWVARGWSNIEIISQAEGFTLPGYTVEQTRRELQTAIEGGRTKWNVPNQDLDFDPETGEIISPVGTSLAPEGPLEAKPLGYIDPRAIPRREWIIGQRLIRKFVTLTIAPPGVGKSTLTMQEMISIVTGNERLTDQNVHINGPAWIYNNEDPLDELQRRIAAICIHFDISPGAIADRLYLNSGRERRLIVAKELDDGGVVMMPDAENLEKEIVRRGIVAMTIDPFVRVHRVSENSNEQIDFVADIFARIADKTGCAFNLVHHTRKAGVTSNAGDPDSARGASSLIGAARIASTLTTMSKQDAEALLIPEDERRWFVRMDDAKASMSAPAEATAWFRRESVDIPNGRTGLVSDSVGVLVPWRPQPRTRITTGFVLPILQEINRGFEEGEPYSAHGGAERYVVTMMMNRFGLMKPEAKQLLNDWKRNGVLLAARKTVNGEKVQGLRVVVWPGTEN